MTSDTSREFKTVECQEFCVRVADGTHDSPKETKVGKKLVTSKNLKGGRLELESAYLISVEDFDSINKRSKVDQWDLLLTMIGTVGEICLVAEPKPNFAIKNVGLLKCADELRAKWLYYFLSSPQGKTLIEQRKKGSTQQYISLSELRKLPISYPEDKRVMRLIVESLDVLDSRINLLRETIATLEAIAQALFKSWFVDFDPVRAKAEGRLPEGMDAATAALFPDAFEETELGFVPRGWSVKCLSVFITESTRRIGDEPAIVLSAVQTGNLVMSSDFFNKRVHSKDISKYKAVEPYSYAYNPSRINIGSIGINEMGVVGAVSPIYVVANPKNICFGYYLWHLLRTNRIRESIKTMSSGTVRQSLAFKDFASIKVALPADEIVNQFFEVREEIFKNINAKENQISVLSNLRDTLLPRLISGQLRIADAEAELEMAMGLL